MPKSTKSQRTPEPALTVTQARKLARKQPRDPSAWHTLGVSLTSFGQIDDAYEAFKRAHELAPGSYSHLEWLGYVDYRRQNSQRAMKHLLAALATEPNATFALSTLGQIHIDRGQFEEALDYLRRAELLTPHDTKILSRLAESLHQTNHYDEAIAIFDRLLQWEPRSYSHWNNIGNVYRDLSRLDDANRCYQHATELDQRDPRPFSNWLTGLHYDPYTDREAISQLAREWQRRFGPINPPPRPVPEDCRHNKRLRIGMLSDGFRQHPVGKMIVRCLEALSHAEFELFAYSSNDVQDRLSQRLRNTFHHWQPIHRLSDDDLAQHIRNDKIDILFDLSGHNTGARMRVMAMQPAPLIVKWVGGLINTTGVAAIDYLISDKNETPPGEDSFYSEKLIRMPDDYIVFDPPASLPDVAPLPYQANGYVTLACFNNPTKLNEVLLAEWSKILHQLPNSKLLLKGRAYAQEELCERLYTSLESMGIGRDRLIIEGPGTNKEMLEAYSRADIALDSWPYSGGLTTCEAFIMGVPVVTLPGPTFAGRHSATHLINAGMPELVVDSWEAYRSRVLELASDADSLATIRRHLREVLLRSPVCDGPRFAEHFSNATRAIWQRYCEDKSPAALSFDEKDQVWFEGEEEPVDIQRPEASQEEEGFKWEFEGKIIAIDNGGQLLHSQVVEQMLQHKTMELVAFDPASEAASDSLKSCDGVHYYPSVSLGDGNPATFYACLDPKHSATLQPLETVESFGGKSEQIQVLTKLPISTIKLDTIEGLPSVDWLVLDDLNDAAAILDNGTQALKDTLLLQVKVTFQPTHERQPNLAELQHWASRNGFRFYRLHEPHHRSHLPKGVPEAQRQATELTSADALFLPSHARMEALSDNQRMRLAFLLHTVHDIKDYVYKLLEQASIIDANYYLEESNFHDSVSKHIDSNALKKVSEDSHQLEGGFNNSFSAEGLGAESLKLAQRLNTALNGRKVVFLATGDMANHGIVQKGQEDLFNSFKGMGINVTWANYKTPLSTDNLINLAASKNYIFYGSNRYYDASVNISGISNQNLFDAFGSPIAAFLGDHPYARFMIERIAKAPKTGLLYGHKSLADEVRFLRPDMPYIQAWSIEPKPTLVLDEPINHSERDIDILVPLNLSFAINSETLYNHIKQKAKALGRKYENLVANMIDTYTDFSVSLMDHFRSIYKETFDKEWHISIPWTRTDIDLIWLLGGLDDVIRGRKRLEALKKLCSSSEKLNIFVLAQEDEKEELTKRIGSKKINDWVFCGTQHADAIEKLYKRSRYVLNVNPTYHDSIHERIRNAAAAGCAIITNKNEKLNSIFKNHKDILFYDANNFPKITRNDIKTSEYIGRNAKETIKIHYTDKQHTEIFRIFAEYIEKIGMPQEKTVTKIFCIGRNKTGTTSVKKAFEDFGFKVGDQRAAEILTDKFYFSGEFKKIVEYCKTASVFQDIPFSYPETYKHLDKAYPGSKFILTVRDSSEQWYHSITRFHSKKFGRNGSLPTADDLKSAEYVRRGFMYNTVKIHGTSDEDPYNKEIMIAHYEKHNREVMEYFKDRPNDLLIINLAKKGAYREFCDFVGIEATSEDFPWENKT